LIGSLAKIRVGRVTINTHIFFIWPNKLHLLFYRYILLSQTLFFIFLACHCLILYIKLPFHSQESNCLLFFLDRYYSITKQKLIYSKMHDDIVIHDQLTGWHLPVTDTQWFYMRTLTSLTTYVTFVIITIPSFLPSWITTGWHNHCHMWSRNYLPFQSTWVHYRFLLEFVLLNL
jgi:hypothetical protein